MAIAKVRIVQDKESPHIVDHLYLNDVDIAPIVRGLSIRMIAGELPRISIDILATVDMSDDMKAVLYINGEETP